MDGITERVLEGLATLGNSHVREARVFRAPGRVNLIGEHTDYNLGFVMPVALDLACYAATAPRVDGILRIHSRNMNDTRELPVDDIKELKPAGHWSDYVLGAAKEVALAGYPVEAADLVIESTVPVGAGLSSSAAIEVSSALAFLRGRSIDKLELVKLARRVENDFVGMPCGIMDQFISVHGQENRAVRLDCRSLGHELVPLPFSVRVIAVNSMVKHDLGASAYPQRVRECAEAVAVYAERIPGVASLRDLTAEQYRHFDEYVSVPARWRARHVISENERVLAFREACVRHDRAEMGQLFYSSHKSMRDDYEISCAEIDFLVETAMAHSGCYGARLTGGGFGGCTVNLVAPEAVDTFKQAVAEAYHKQFGIIPTFYDCHPAAGAGEASLG
ncbi:MAG: galactokinase [Bryobacterales bacterium]|nr:galactokinase [Bryobacterales bacterium]